MVTGRTGTAARTIPVTNPMTPVSEPMIIKVIRPHPEATSTKAIHPRTARALGRAGCGTGYDGGSPGGTAGRYGRKSLTVAGYRPPPTSTLVRRPEIM